MASKRISGTFTVRQRGAHWLVFTNHNGKREAKSFKTKDVADTFAKKVDKALKSATWNLGLLEWKVPGAVDQPAAVTTFGQFAERCLSAKEPNAHGRLERHPQPQPQCEVRRRG